MSREPPPLASHRPVSRRARWWIRHEARMFRSYDGEEYKARPHTLEELRNLVVIGQRLPKRHREVRP